MKNKKKFIALTVFICVMRILAFAETKAIANWDIVPFQMFSEPFNIGVVAFHETGINVEFVVNNVSYRTVDEPTYNPDSKVYEYWVTIDPAHYTDGPLMVGAVAHPDDRNNFSRELQNLTFYMNAHGALSNDSIMWADAALGDDETGNGSEENPYKTLEKAFVEVGEGGTVYLKAGLYEMTALYPAANYTYWTTITRAPGLQRRDVRIVGYSTTTHGRFGENMVRWKDIVMYKDAAPGYSVIMYFENTHHIWMDGSEFFDAKGQWNGGNIFGGNRGFRVYVTGCFIHDIANTTGLYYLRDVYIKDICSDIYRGRNNLLGVNVVVDGIDRGQTEAHPDFIQFYNPGIIVENVILYNNKVYNMGAQGIFGADCKDVAFVNLLMEKDPADSYAISQNGGTWDHILLWHVTTVDAGYLLRNPPGLSNFNVQNCVWHSFNAGQLTTLIDSYIAHNHFVNKSWDQINGFMGTDFTSGDPLFFAVESDDYRLTEESSAKNAGVPLPGVPADVNGNPWDLTSPSLGCFEFGYEDVPYTLEDFDDTTDISITAWDPTRTFLTVQNNIITKYNHEAKIICNVQSSGDLFLGIFDSKGNKVITLANEYYLFGEHERRWAGQDSSGNKVGSGIYMVYMKIGSIKETKKIAVVR